MKMRKWALLCAALLLLKRARVLDRMLEELNR